MLFEYWTFGNAGAVLQLLNGIAAVMAPTSGFIGAAKVAALLGFLLILIGAALKSDPMPVVSWFLALVIGWYVAFVPKVTMVVYDSTPAGSTAGYNVDNIPLGLAFVASAGSKFSHWLTATAETVFSLPEGAKFTNAGLLRPQKIMMASSGYSLPNAQLDSDWQAFFHECTYYDINTYSKRLGIPGMVTEESLRNATDPLTELGKTNNVLFVNIVTGGVATRTCKEAYDILKAATDTLANTSSVQAKYAKLAFPELSASDAQTAYAQAISDSNQILYNSSLSTAETIKNRWMVNMLRMRETRSAISSGNTALAMVEFGVIQAENQRLNAYLQSARAAQDTIPTIRNILEAVCIGLFPVTVILMILVGYGGLRLFAEWAMLYLSLQLWGFCYALMNLIMISKNATNVFAIASQASTTYVSTANVGGVVEQIAADMAMAGQMAWAIPILCYGLVRGLGTAGTSMARMAAGPAQSGSEHLGSGLGAGNNNVGVSKYGEVSAPGTVSVGSGSGTDTFYGGFGGSAANPVRHTGWLSQAAAGVNSSIVAGAALTSAARKTEQMAEQQGVAAESMQQSALGQTISHALNAQNSTGIDQAWSEQGRGSFSQGQEATQAIVDDVKRATGADQSTATRLLADAGMGTKMFSPVMLGAEISKNYGSQAKLSFDQSQSAKNSDGYKEANQWANTLASSANARHSVMGGSSDSKGIESRFQEAASLKEQSQASMQQSQALEQQASAALKGDASINQNIVASNPTLARAISNAVASDDYRQAGAVGDYATQMHMVQNAMARAGLDAKALTSLVQMPQAGQMPSTPQTLADGSTAPTSQSLQGDYAQAAQGIRHDGQQAIDANRAQAPQVSVGGPDISGIQQRVESGQKDIQGKVAAGQQLVQTGHATVQRSAQANLPQYMEDADGTMSLRVPQSQVATVSRNLGSDAGIAAQAVVNAGANLLGGAASAASVVANASTAAIPEPIHSFVTGPQSYGQVNQPTSVKYGSASESDAVKQIPK